MPRSARWGAQLFPTELSLGSRPPPHLTALTAALKVLSSLGWPDQLWPQAWLGMVASGAPVPQPLSISCQPAGALIIPICVCFQSGVSVFVYGFLIRTWQKGSRVQFSSCGESGHRGSTERLWTIKRVLCLPGCPSPSHGDKSQPERKIKGTG